MLLFMTHYTSGFHRDSTSILTAPHLGIDLRDVEDVDVYTALAEKVGGANAAPAFVVVAGDDLGRLQSEVGEALEDILRCAGRKVGNQLRIDGQIGSEHKEVLDVPGMIQVGNERAHEARFGGIRKPGNTASVRRRWGLTPGPERGGLCS